MRDHEHYWFGLWIGASVGRAQADSKGKGDERAVFRRELRKNQPTVLNETRWFLVRLILLSRLISQNEPSRIQHELILFIHDQFGNCRLWSIRHEGH